ncbi:MAG: c-type cytochrome [Caldilineaceae bacterium]
MKRQVFITIAALVIVLLVTACTPSGFGPFTRFASNGERIYFTGTSANGPISYSGGDYGPMAGRGMMGRGMMRGISLACADCHGSDAKGGQHFMHMQLMDAPDIRWRTLTSGEEAGDTHADEGGHEMAHEPYTPETFARAVRNGIDPAGNPLDAAMPRWQMSDQDITDLIEFLQTK